ncbi:hydroxymethylglutaryl-CoA lyase [Paraflavisolibacter sp. H34]|uniref:hydroxymethylglutaryl-CoA lyase n=1 Tax=Huijunlia imazamoxiresistens TaxID=3127457 RepID=UPI003017EF1E
MLHPTPAPPVQLVECPRDAMQGWKEFIPTEKKAAYINALLQVGFDTIDFGSFVSPRAIPQMSDTKEVLQRLERTGTRSKLLAIVANRRGAEAALAFEEIDVLGFPFSLSPTFQQRNTNSTMEESLGRVAEIQELCLQKNRQLVVYLSMGFGNPYGDAYHPGILLHWAGEMVRRGITIISLADTVGLATPEQVGEAVAALVPQYPGTTIGVHLHAAPLNRRAKLEAAFAAGCRRFDGALKGIGGCPMADDELVGNMATEVMVDFFSVKGVLPPLDFAALQNSGSIAAEIFGL